MVILVLTVHLREIIFRVDKLSQISQILPNSRKYDSAKSLFVKSISENNSLQILEILTKI
jgi:hypothetical protein